MPSTFLPPYTSPSRPQSSYSARSTIRRVTPSPELLSEVLAAGYAAHSTQPRPQTADANLSLDSLVASAIPGLDRGGGRRAGVLRRAPAGRVSPGKKRVSGGPGRGGGMLARSTSLPAHREVSGSTALTTVITSGSTSITSSRPHPPAQKPQLTTTMPPRSAPDSRPTTPTPMTAAQRRNQYMPMRSSPAPSTPNLSQTSIPPASSPSAMPAATIYPAHPHFFQTPAKGTSTTSYDPNASTSTGARSAHSHGMTFSTPGRDELERKKMEPHMGPFARDEGPFGTAVSVADLREKRRKVSEGGKRKVEGRSEKGGKGGRDGGCLCACNVGRCVVM